MRYILSILGILLLAVLVIVIIAKGGNHPIPVSPPNLNSYGYLGTSVSQITNGVLTGESQRQALEITVSQDNRNIEVLNGYERTVVNSESFANTPAAYTTFLSALQQAGFTKSRPTTEVNKYGVCPLGDTYEYSLNTPTKTVTNLWSTSCFLTDGTFDGQGSLIRNLFQLQIPNFTQFTQNLTIANTI